MFAQLIFKEVWVSSKRERYLKNKTKNKPTTAKTLLSNGEACLYTILIVEVRAQA